MVVGGVVLQGAAAAVVVSAAADALGQGDTTTQVDAILADLRKTHYCVAMSEEINRGIGAVRSMGCTTSPKNVLDCGAIVMEFPRVSGAKGYAEGVVAQDSGAVVYRRGAWVLRAVGCVAAGIDLARKHGGERVG